MARSMLLLSWNVAGRVRNLAAQIQAIERHGGPEEVESLWRRREFFNNPIDSVRDAIRRDQER